MQTPHDMAIPSVTSGSKLKLIFLMFKKQSYNNHRTYYKYGLLNIILKRKTNYFSLLLRGFQKHIMLACFKVLS